MSGCVSVRIIIGLLPQEHVARVARGESFEGVHMKLVEVVIGVLRSNVGSKRYTTTNRLLNNLNLQHTKSFMSHKTKVSVRTFRSVQTSNQSSNHFSINMCNPFKSFYWRSPTLRHNC